MSPRPRPRHSGTEGRLFAALHERLGRDRGASPPDWLFLVEPEIRSEPNLTRLVPDVAGWRRSTSGWPDLDRTPIEVVPDWVAEVLSPSTEAADRGEKLGAYGAIGVGWLSLVDCERRRVETLVNVRGQMVPEQVFESGDARRRAPFETESLPLASFIL